MKSELVGKHYHGVEKQFKIAEEKGKKGKGKVMEQAVEGEAQDGLALVLEEKRKTLIVNRVAGVEVKDMRLELRTPLEMQPEEQEWQDGVEGHR